MNIKEMINSAIDQINILVKGNDTSKFDKINISKNQMITIITELDEMLKNIENRKKYFPHYAHVIVDSWNSTEEPLLQKLLLQIDSKYRHNKK